jgi:hypothetical protein
VRSARGLPGPVGALAALTIALALAPADAGARGISAKHANRIALARLGRFAHQRKVIVFRSRAPLAARTRVGVADPKGRTVRLRHRAWLFWANLVPTADLDHPSVLLLVDADTGRLVKVARLLSWPLVNGRLPAFLRSFKAYRAGANHVLVRGRAAHAAAVSPRARPVARAATAPAAGQCVIVVGAPDSEADNWDWGEHVADERTFTRFARDGLGIHAISHAGSLSQLDDRIGLAQRSGCSRITIFMTGEGSPVPGWIDPVTHVGPYRGNARPSLKLDKDNHRIYGPDLAVILRDRRAAPPEGVPPPTFTLIVQGCFGGRFFGSLRGVPGVERVIASSGPQEESTREPNVDKLLSGPRPSPFLVELLGGIHDLFGDVKGDLGDAAESAFTDDVTPSEDKPEMLVEGRIISKGPLAVSKCTNFHQPGCIDFHGGVYSGGDHRSVATGGLQIKVDSTGFCEQVGCEFEDCYVCPHLDTSFPKGDTVTAVATPGKDSMFARWGHGVCAGQGPTCTFTATKPSCITAQFLLVNPTAPPQTLPDVTCVEDP